MKYKFWINWLKVASLLVIAFGIFMAFSSIIPNSIFAVFDNKINPSFFCELEFITSSMKDFQLWQYGIGAAMMVSWGILIFFITKYPLSKKEKWAWNAILICLIGWFIIDETISLYYRVYFNAIFNIGFLAIFLIPILSIRKYLVKD